MCVQKSQGQKGTFKDYHGLRKALVMTRHALSVWQSEDKQSASLKALSKSVCMPFRALAGPKCQSNIWQKHITPLSLSFPLPGSFLISFRDLGLTKGLNHSDIAHDGCSFRGPLGFQKTTKKMRTECEAAFKASGITLYVVLQTLRICHFGLWVARFVSE